jgi:hypothetical protein
MNNYLCSVPLAVILLFTSCNEQKEIDTRKQLKKHIEGLQPYLNLETYHPGNITLECFDLNQISIKDKERFVYGYHYFCDRKNAETGGSSEVFANGLVKINNKIEILEPFFGSYYINENYLIEVELMSHNYQKGDPKTKIIVFDLKKKIKCTSSFYFSWFCEA